MPENQNQSQSQQDTTEVSVFEVLSNQVPVPSVWEAYEETNVPYLPSPNANPLQTTSLSSKPNPPRSSPEKTENVTSGCGIVVGGVLGAILAGMIGPVVFPEGSPLMWASLGAVVGVTLSLLASFFADEDGARSVLAHSLGSFDLSYVLHGLDASNCCGHFAILIVASIGTIGGLLLWHNWLLAAQAGAGVIVMILVSWFCALLKHLLVKRLNSKGNGSAYTNMVNLRYSTPAKS